jgi:hypothetical protein
MKRGEQFEASLPRTDYFSEGYFDIRQLMAQMMQIKYIHDLKPRSIIEIGIGNGLTSTFIRNSGIDILTADINPNLNPDICCPISEVVDAIRGRKFDLVVCCEVLEHTPLDQLEMNIRTLRTLGNRLFLTLPGYTKSFGVSGVIKFPWLKARDFFVHIFLPKNEDLALTEHFWEVGSERATHRGAIVAVLKKHYTKVRTGRMSFQPNQIYFIAE